MREVDFNWINEMNMEDQEYCEYVHKSITKVTFIFPFISIKRAKRNTGTIFFYKWEYKESYAEYPHTVLGPVHKIWLILKRTVRNFSNVNDII